MYFLVYFIFCVNIIIQKKKKTFEDLLERGKSRTSHEDNLHKLLVEIFKSCGNNVQIMWNFFDLKKIRYNLRGNYLMKLLDTSTCRNCTQALCFKGSLLWNKIPKKYKNLNSLEEFKS